MSATLFSVSEGKLFWCLSRHKRKSHQWFPTLPILVCLGEGISLGELGKWGKFIFCLLNFLLHIVYSQNIFLVTKWNFTQRVKIVKKKKNQKNQLWQNESFVTETEASRHCDSDGSTQKLVLPDWYQLPLFLKMGQPHCLPEKVGCFGDKTALSSKMLAQGSFPIMQKAEQLTSWVLNIHLGCGYGDPSVVTWPNQNWMVVLGHISQDLKALQNKWQVTLLKYISVGQRQKKVKGWNSEGHSGKGIANFFYDGSPSWKNSGPLVLPSPASILLDI